MAAMTLAEFCESIWEGDTSFLEVHATLRTEFASVQFDLTVRLTPVPPPDVIREIRFTEESGHMKGQIVLNTVDPSFALTSRPVAISINGGTPFTVDMIDPSVTFDVNPGDTVDATPTGAVNATGTGPAGATFSATAPPVVVPLPEADVVEAINFLP